MTEQPDPRIVWYHRQEDPDAVSSPDATPGRQLLRALFTTPWIAAAGAWSGSQPSAQPSPHQTPASGSLSDESRSTLQLFESPTKRPRIAERHMWTWPHAPPDPRSTHLTQTPHPPARSPGDPKHFCPVYVGESSGSLSLSITAIDGQPPHSSGVAGASAGPAASLPPCPLSTAANEHWTDFSRLDKSVDRITRGSECNPKVWPGPFRAATTTPGTGARQPNLSTPTADGAGASTRAAAAAVERGVGRHRRVRVVIPCGARDDAAVTAMRKVAKRTLTGLYMVTLQAVYLTDDERAPDAAAIPYPCCGLPSDINTASGIDLGAQHELGLGCDGTWCQWCPGAHVWCQESQVAEVLVRLRSAGLAPTTCVIRGEGHVPLSVYLPPS